MSSFIKNPSTIEEFKQNIDFQMDNVKGWLSVNDYQSALIKAKCLVDALMGIVAFEESEQIEDEAEFCFCDNCDLPAACEDFGCAIRQGIRPAPDL